MSLLAKAVPVAAHAVPVAAHAVPVAANAVPVAAPKVTAAAVSTASVVTVQKLKTDIKKAVADVQNVMSKTSKESNDAFAELVNSFALNTLSIISNVSSEIQKVNLNPAVSWADAIADFTPDVKEVFANTLAALESNSVTQNNTFITQVKQVIDQVVVTVSLKLAKWLASGNRSNLDWTINVPDLFAKLKSVANSLPTGEVNELLSCMAFQLNVTRHALHTLKVLSGKSPIAGVTPVDINARMHRVKDAIASLANVTTFDNLARQIIHELYELKLSISPNAASEIQSVESSVLEDIKTFMFDHMTTFVDDIIPAVNKFAKSVDSINKSVENSVNTYLNGHGDLLLLSAIRLSTAFNADVTAAYDTFTKDRSEAGNDNMKLSLVNTAFYNKLVALVKTFNDSMLNVVESKGFILEISDGLLALLKYLTDHSDTVTKILTEFTDDIINEVTHICEPSARERHSGHDMGARPYDKAVASVMEKHKAENMAFCHGAMKSVGKEHSWKRK